jgi:hypothetical protein
MDLNLAEMKEEELLKQWSNQTQTNLKIIKRIKNFAERAEGLLTTSGEFYTDTNEFISLEEMRQYLKNISQIKQLVNHSDEVLDNLEKLHRVYKMRSKNQRIIK